MTYKLAVNRTQLIRITNYDKKENVGFTLYDVKAKINCRRNGTVIFIRRHKRYDTNINIIL